MNDATPNQVSLIAEATLTKLQSIPAKTEVAPDGFRFAVIGYKTDKITKVKPATVAFLVPALRPSLIGMTEAQQKMVYGMIDGEQNAAVKEFAGGELESLTAIQSFSGLADYWGLDGRGNRTGVKQSAIMEWLTDEFAPYFKARIDRSLAAQPQAQRDTLVLSYMNAYGLAATRGNKRTDKRGDDESVSLPKMKDLVKRMENYLTDDLPGCDEATALMARMNGHIAVMERAAVEDAISNDDF